MNQMDKNCLKSLALGESQALWSENTDRVLLKNRNTKCVAPMNVIDSQTVLKHSVIHLPAKQQSQSQSQSSTSTSSLSGSSTSNSLNSHTMNSCGSGASPLENLPKKFVSSMRTLFDIMDDKRTGFVRLVDIEARWQDDGSKGLPHGVIDCLRRVTPISGMLSFERFCAGLKICLLRNQANEYKITRRSSTDSNLNMNITNETIGQQHINIKINNDNNNNTNDINKNENNLNINNSNKNHFIKNGHIEEDKKVAKIYKRSSLPVQRTLSLPKLSPSSDGESSSDPCIVSVAPAVFAPPKPPRTALHLVNDTTNLSGESKDGFDKAEIRNALQNWQMNVLMHEWEAKDKRRAMAIPNTSFINRGTADGSPTITNQQPPNSFQTQMMSHQQHQHQHQQQQQQQQQPQHQQQQHHHHQQKQNLNSHTVQKPIQAIYPTNRSPTLLEFQKKTNRRREIRRHTLQNGIDYNMIKRIRHYEEEKNLLLDGLHAVESAQEWYFKQIALVQEKMKCLGRGDTHLEQWSEAHEERLDLRRARIVEVNRCLASLEDSWERGGLPMHMNLAVRNHNLNNSNHNNDNNDLVQFHDIQVNQLKSQNRQLTEEVSQKCERITALEMERKSLYRELLQHQQQQQQLQQQLLRKQGHILCGNEEVFF